ncbi:MAG TPA: hypothetical protein VIQ97_02455 [Prevotella sp.]
MQDSHCKIVAAIVVLFTAIQLLILATFGYTPYPDSEGYLLLARQCVEQAQWYPMANSLHELPFLWNIGAINAVVASLYLFHSITPLLVFYAFLKGATALITYLLTAKLANRRMALVALLLYVAYPANHGECTSLLSEIPFIFFSLLGVYLSLCRHPFYGASLLAVANWFRPMGMVFLATLIIYHLVQKNRKYLLQTLAGYALMIMLIGGTAYISTHRFIFQAKTGWMALLQYSIDQTQEEEHIYLPDSTDCIEKDALWRQQALRWIVQHPTEYVAQMPKKMANTYVSDNVNLCTFLPNKAHRPYLYSELSMQTLKTSFPKLTPVQALTVFNLLYYYALMGLFLMSIVYFYRRRKLKLLLLPLSIVVIGTLVLLFAGHGEARFHLPFMPFIIMADALFIGFKKQIQ